MPTPPAHLLEPIRRLQRENRLQDALETAKTTFRDHPSPQAEALLGLLLCQTGDPDAGRQHLENALGARSGLDAETLTDLAGIHILLGEPAAALALLERALSLQPNYPPARVRRGLVRLQTGRWRRAVADLESGLKSLPPAQHAAIHINLARAYLGMGEPETALAQIRSAKTLDPTPNGRAYRLEVDAWLALDRWAEAETAVRNALEEGIEEKRCLGLFVLVLAAQNRHDEAEHHLRKALEQTPSATDLLLRLAELAEVRGRFGEALHCLRRAVDAEPDKPTLWAKLAALGKRRLEPELARQAAEKALALTQDMLGRRRAEALAAMAGVEKDEDRSEQAERYYRQALEQFADYLPARLGLGHLLLQWGRIDEAVAEFEKVAERHPAAGLSALAAARRFPDDPAILARIEKIAHLPSLEGPVKSGLLFDLAAAWEHRQDYAKAFHFAAEANAASRRFLPYSAPAHRQRCNRIMQAFSAEFFESRRDYGHPASLPVFVLGMPRSGTTLVEQIIAGHPDIHGAGEIGVVTPIIQSLAYWERRSGSGRDYPACVDDITPRQALGYAEKMLEHLQAYAPKARHIVDKLPHNFENIGLIRLLFPNAPIIHVLREPRDVAVSNFFTDYQAKFGGMGFAYDLADLGQHLADYQRLMAHWERVLPKPILTLRYEDVVDDVATAARTLLDYIGVGWHPAVLDFQDLERAVKTASVWQVRQPIYRTSKAKWRRYAEYLAPLETALAEEIPPVPLADDLAPLPPGLFFLGIEHLEAGRGRDAEETFRRLLDRYPNHAAANHFLGMALYQQGQPLKALKRIKRSLALHPGHADWHRNLGQVLAALNMPAEAAAAMAQCQALQRRFAS